MPLAFYKANKRNTGSLLAFRVTADKKQETSIMASITRQDADSWDYSRKTASFSNSAKDQKRNVFVKLSLNELADILQVLEGRGRENFSAYHVSPSTQAKVQISLSLAAPKDGKVVGYFFSINKDGERFTTPLAFGEARRLQSFVETFLNMSDRNVIVKDLEESAKYNNQRK